VTTWALEGGVDHLNHGAYGACPLPVLEAQRKWRDRMESDPTRFMTRDLPGALEGARTALGAFLGAAPAGIVFVPNATAGVNAVLRSLEPDLGPGDEIVVSSHTYNACRNAVEVTAIRTGASVVTAPVPFPIASPDEAVEAVVGAVSGRTRLVLLDHVSSPTALVMPVERVVALLEPQVPVVVDGAHAPGMVPMALDDLGASFATGNCHKWMCAPKGAGYLHVRADRRDAMVPPVVSHGLNQPLADDETRFHALFDWPGTSDLTPWLVVPDAIEAVGRLHRDGWPGVMSANRDLALAARRIVCDSLDLEPPAPEDMVGSMATVILPGASPGGRPGDADPLMSRLRDEAAIVVPVFGWIGIEGRLLRLSAQRYNSVDQYERLADALAGML